MCSQWSLPRTLVRLNCLLFFSFFSLLLKGTSLSLLGDSRHRRGPSRQSAPQRPDPGLPLPTPPGPSPLPAGDAVPDRKPLCVVLTSPAQRPRPRPGCPGDEGPPCGGWIMAASVGTTPGGTTPAGMTPAGTTPESEVRRPCPVPATPERPPPARGRGWSRGGAAAGGWVRGPECRRVWERVPGGAGSGGVRGGPGATAPRSPSPAARRASCSRV